MARLLRYIPPFSFVEVFNKTFQDRFLLRPSAELNNAIHGILGRYQDIHGIKIIAFCFLSNHFHMILFCRCGEQLANFMRDFQSALAREVRRLYGWSGKVFRDRYRHSVLVDEDIQIARLRYVLEQGCKENLVARPQDWPGVTGIDAILENKDLYGTWYDRSAYYEACRSNKTKPGLEDFATRYTVKLSPLPAWGDNGFDEYRKFVRATIGEIERETAQRHRAENTRPLGIRKILSKHPHHQPQNTKRSRQSFPLIMASTREIRRKALDAFRAFVLAFREASAAYLAGAANVVFPAHCFPPRHPFINQPIALTPL